MRYMFAIGLLFCFPALVNAQQVVIDLSKQNEGDYYFKVSKDSLGKLTVNKIDVVWSNGNNQPDEPDQPDNGNGFGFNRDIQLWLSEKNVDKKLSGEFSLALTNALIEAEKKNGVTTTTQLVFLMKQVRKLVYMRHKENGFDWQPIEDKIVNKLQSLRTNGKLVSYDDHLKAYQEMAEGARLYTGNETMQAIDIAFIKWIIEMILMIIQQFS